MPDETAKLKLGKGRWIDIGDQEGLGFTVRAIDCGGVVFEDANYLSLIEAWHH